MTALKKSNLLTLCAFATATALSSAARADTPPPAREEAVEKKAEPEPEHLRIGALGGVGFPRPLSIEALVRVEGLVAVGAEYSLLPSTTIAGVDTSFWAVAGDVRLFPFKGAFFIGARVGRQHASAGKTFTASALGTTVSATESASVDTLFVNPRLGFLWRIPPGIALGIDAGVQLPVSSTATSTLPSGVQGSSEIATATDVIGKRPLPTIDLLQVGFLF